MEKLSRLFGVALHLPADPGSPYRLRTRHNCIQMNLLTHNDDNKWRRRREIWPGAPCDGAPRR